MGMGLQLEIIYILKRRVVVAGRERKNNVAIRIFILRENIGGYSVEVRITEAGGESDLGTNPKQGISSEESTAEPRRAIREAGCDPRVERIWEVRKSPSALQAPVWAEGSDLEVDRTVAGACGGWMH
ncbi:hypothetical protein Dimus_029266 [Dionaea muscipula]